MATSWLSYFSIFGRAMGYVSGRTFQGWRIQIVRNLLEVSEMELGYEIHNDDYDDFVHEAT